MENDLTIACAWCGKIIRAGLSGNVSHGICPDCYKKQINEINRLKEKLNAAYHI